MKTQLDTDIEAALRRLSGSTERTLQDVAAYIQSFRSSAQSKAAAVLTGITEAPQPFNDSRPVFISVGGGDGEELLTLLRQSRAITGILIEAVPELAEAARNRRTEVQGKTLFVLEGDAPSLVSRAIDLASTEIREGRGDFVAISCHAVIHELYDRSDHFNVTEFFGTLFKCHDLPTWFTYREPGTPDKWPDRVILRANCSPASLLSLSRAITERHPSLASLQPQAHPLGDGICLHKTLAMEILVKLPYLEDLKYEIEERSTAVEHSVLQNTLMLAIGDNAMTQKRAAVKTSSASTASFERHWNDLSIDVRGLDERDKTTHLAIAESQTRAIAWRLPEGDASKPAALADSAPVSPVETAVPDKHVRPDLSVAEEALSQDDAALLSSLIASRGRAWIESDERRHAIIFLERVRTRFPNDSFQFLLAHYLLSLADLFSGKATADMFQDADERRANSVGLGLLFRAERMEFERKLGHLDAAVLTANSLVPAIPESVLSSASDMERYVVATSRFVLANLLRHGGEYRRGWQEIDLAQRLYRPTIDSHATELAHCHYAKTICVAITGVADFELHISDAERSNQLFASALIELAYSHAEWFVGDVERAATFADSAAEVFDAISSPHYAKRARLLAWFLRSWRNPDLLKSPPDDQVAVALAGHLRTLVGLDGNVKGLAAWLTTQRASNVVGILQFAARQPIWERELSIALPRTLFFDERRQIAWRPDQVASSLKELDSVLRGYLQIPLSRRVPLVTD